MKHKMMYLLAVVLVAVSFSLSHAADPQYTIESPISRLTSGGPFLVDPVASGSSFYSFCLELNEYLSVGGTYFGTIDKDVIRGGIGGGSPDPLSIETKYLYDYVLDNGVSSFSNEELAGVQLAIWKFENEITVFSGDYTANATFYETLANSKASVWTPDRQIMALNLYGSSPTDYKQSLLTQVPEPASLLLLGLGLCGAAFAVRRQKSRG